MQTKDISDYQVVAACQAARTPRPSIADLMRLIRETAEVLDGTRPPDSKPGSLELLMQRTGAPEKVCLQAMERACGRGLIDWGVSIYYAWPTPEGDQYVEEHRIEEEG